MKTTGYVLALLCGLLAATPALAGADATVQYARGKNLFGLCAQCHGRDGAGIEANLAPAIAGLPEWYVLTQLGKFREGIRGTHFDDIAGMRMRPMARTLRSQADVEAVSAFVASLPPTRPERRVLDGDPVRGAQLFAPCTACHGPEALGNPSLNAPPLRQASDWYLLRQLQNFRAGIRGVDARDTSGLLMRPMSFTLPDEQALKDVIAHIKTLSEAAR